MIKVHPARLQILKYRLLKNEIKISEYVEAFQKKQFHKKNWRLNISILFYTFVPLAQKSGTKIRSADNKGWFPTRMYSYPR